MDGVETTEDTSSKLGTEGVPDTVLDLLLLAGVVHGGDADALLAVDALSGGQVARDEQVLLALGDVDTLVPVGLDGDGARSLLAEAGLAATATTAAAGTTATTAATTTARACLCQLQIATTPAGLLTTTATGSATATAASAEGSAASASRTAAATAATAESATATATAAASSTAFSEGHFVE